MANLGGDVLHEFESAGGVRKVDIESDEEIAPPEDGCAEVGMSLVWAKIGGEGAVDEFTESAFSEVRERLSGGGVFVQEDWDLVDL